MSSAGGETYRLETFTDAVFAIAITLLILEIRLPPHEELEQAGGLVPALLNLWPSYLGYVLSFVVIGIMWVNHHSFMKLVDRLDHRFIVLNLLLLLCVSFLPFPTAVMADHLTNRHDREVSVAFYCGSFTVTAVFYFLLWLHASHDRRLIAADVSDDDIRRITRAYAPGPVLYLAATLLAFAHVAISLGIVFVLAVWYMLPKRGAHAAAANRESH